MPVLAQWVAVSCGVGHRCGLNLMWLWLWLWLAAIAPSGPLAWELPSAMSAASKIKKKKKSFATRWTEQEIIIIK